ncbi:MAG: alpha/beta hydrolase [Betaproteobacteria bacterium]
MTRRTEHTLQVDGLSIAVTEWGEPNVPDAPAVVMLHGIRGYAETFVHVAQALQPQRRVIAFDQRGRGRSDWDPQRRYVTATYVADLLAVADQLGLARFDLLGHSMGGINAIVFSSTYPTRVRRLLIEDAGPGAFEHSPGAGRIKRELEQTPAGFESWEAASAYMRALRPSVPEAARQQRLQEMLRPRRAEEGAGFTWRYDLAGIAAVRLNPDPAQVVDLAPHVRSLACPTLVVRGGRSDYLQPDMAQAMADANPRLRWMEIADAGHYVHDDQPEVFHRVAREFLLEEAADAGAPSGSTEADAAPGAGRAAAGSGAAS